MLFQDVNRVNWRDIEDAAPAFVTLFSIPFTYSIINGITARYLVYIITGIFTGSLFLRFQEMLFFYKPDARDWKIWVALKPYIRQQHDQSHDIEMQPSEDAFSRKSARCR